MDKRRGRAEEKEQHRREKRGGGAEMASGVENRCDCCHSFGILFPARSREGKRIR